MSCTRLSTIDIPETVISIGDFAFQLCQNLKYVYLQSTTPPTIYKAIFAQCSELAKISVPMSAVEAYKSAPNWSTYADIIVGRE